MQATRWRQSYFSQAYSLNSISYRKWGLSYCILTGGINCNTRGSLSTQVLFNASSFLFKVYLIVLLTVSSWPVCLRVMGWWEFFLFLTIHKNPWLFCCERYLPLFDTREWKTSNWQMMFFQINLEVLDSLIYAKGSASPHLVK